MGRIFRVLSIDGGGIRGIIPAMVLAEFERLTGKPVCELFDLIAGTSTGGIIALGLTKPGGPDGPQYAAADLVKLYEDEGPRIFPASVLRRIFSLNYVLDKKYPSGPIDDVLEGFFGDAMLSKALTPVLIPSYEIELRSAFFFKSHNAAGKVELEAGKEPKDYDFRMRDVARATAAAPTYFAPGRVHRTGDDFAFVDGGTYANNPTMCALAEAICSTKFKQNLTDVFVVSLGTGQQTKSRPIRYEEAKNWGALGWAQHILGVVFDGVGDTVDFQTNLILSTESANSYYRLQVDLPRGQDNYKLDDVRPATISKLKKLAEKLIDERKGDIADICKRLAPPPPRRRAAATKRRVAATKGRAAPRKAGATATTRARATKKAAR